MPAGGQGRRGGRVRAGQGGARVSSCCLHGYQHACTWLHTKLVGRTTSPACLAEEQVEEEQRHSQQQSPRKHQQRRAGAAQQGRQASLQPLHELDQEERGAHLGIALPITHHARAVGS